MAFLAQKLISASGATEETDDDFNLVTGLYHFDGSNGATNQGNTTFNSASSGSGNINTYPSGKVGQGTFSPFSSEEGKWSVSFDGTDDYLSLPNHSDFTFGSGNWTVEAFVNVNEVATGGSAAYKCIYSASYGVQFYVIGTYLHLAINDTDNTSGYMIASFSTSGQIASAGVWYHVAAYRDGSNFYCSVDGVVSAMGTSSATIATPSAQAPSIGIWGNTSLPMNGYISNLRVIKGTALYGSSNFTAPSSPLTAVTNTKLLTCCSNRFRDKSTSAHTITPSSVPKIKPFSPFAPSAAYDAAVNGGSVNLEAVASGYVADLWGSLNLSSLTFGTGDFTIEAWIYKKVSGEGTIYNGSYHTAQQSPILQVTSSNKLSFLLDTTAQATSSEDVPLNSWTHVAVSKASSTGYLLMNGVQVGTWSDSHTYPAPYLYYFFGCNNAQTGSAFVGNFAARILKGTGLYTGSYTVPTSPFTDITNTVTLLNGAGGALFDQTGKTNAITVGNAQLDTSVKKFGTASLELDNTGDYLPLSQSSFVPLGSGDFTIECFVRFSTVASSGIFQLSNGTLNATTRGPAAGCSASTGKWGIYYGTTWYEPASSQVPSTNTWYHVAFVRNSGTSKLYIDGTEMVSASDSTNYTDTYFTIGGWYSTGYLMHGYIDEFRISLKARYTSNFTAPTEEFANR